MSVQVEFFGIPRQRAGVAETSVEAATLAELLDQLAERHAALAKSCFDNGCLQPGFLINVNGQTFTTDPATPLKPGDCVLLLSADVGG